MAALAGGHIAVSSLKRFKTITRKIDVPCTAWKLLALLAFMSLAACSTYHYKDYQADWSPDKMVPYDLSNHAPNSPIVYFATVRFHAIGIPFHRFLLATNVDGTLIPGAGGHSVQNISGEQALRLTPGKHSLIWCWVSMNGLGTGGAKCGLEALDVEFGRPAIRCGLPCP